ncbi:hypothetical protein SAMN05443637_1284 [Pseudonocardia thermophila]|jgi:hypothetical protein|uniref:Uncharacterized protein n=1 Tax=Pseudonocardia thermophila TaxID=1848 RepID=A0A1M7AH60_PSETH|nr:hypothetical protein [Pseudonocardia thermophila]SHL42102.1 hypothetical protein SAMN05443637_1284 [Pseudonocardia thermophila]
MSMLRTCSRCGQTDDHPRHVIAAPAGQQGANFHHRCHAQLGCPLCIEQLKGAGDAEGEDLRAYLLANPLSDERVAELLGQESEG